MSLGSKIVLVRMGEGLIEQVMAEVKRLNETRREEPYTVSSFIRDAVNERLTKRERRKQKGAADAGV